MINVKLADASPKLAPNFRARRATETVQLPTNQMAPGMTAEHITAQEEDISQDKEIPKPDAKLKRSAFAPPRKRHDQVP